MPGPNTFFRPRRLWVLVAYLAGVALFFELSARAVLALPSVQRRLERASDDASWRLRWARRQQHGAGIYYRFDEPHATRGWAVKPGLRDLRVFDDRALNTNSAGLRGRREFAVPKRPGLTRVIVFGDSFTFGDEVSDDQTYVEQLARLLPHVEVLNLGVHGYGHDQMLLYLREAGRKLQPDVVLLGFVADDMERNRLGFRDFAKPRFELVDAQLQLRGVPVATPEAALRAEWRRSRVVDLFTILRGLALARSGRAQAEQERLTYAILDEFRDEGERLGARVAYAYLPVHGELTKPDARMTRREQVFFAYCRERGIQSMYLQRFFLKKLRGGQSFKTYGHWDALEHLTAAEGIAAYLVEKGLVPAAPEL